MSVDGADGTPPGSQMTTMASERPDDDLPA